MATRNVPQPGGLGSPPGAPIQVVPPGLLGLLQLKSLGSAPQQLLEQVGGVIELRDWYLTARRLDAFALFPAGVPAVAIATGNAGEKQFLSGGNPAIVPIGQIWYVEQYGASGLGAAAADVLNFGVALTNPGQNQIFEAGPIVFDVVSARVRFYSAKTDRGFWAFPGDQFTVITHDVSTAGINLIMSMRATPMQV